MDGESFCIGGLIGAAFIAIVVSFMSPDKSNTEINSTNSVIVISGRDIKFNLMPGCKELNALRLNASLGDSPEGRRAPESQAECGLGLVNANSGEDE